MPVRRVARFIVRFSMRGMSWFIVCVDRCANRSTQRPADNRTITSADFIAYCRTGSSSDAATNCRI